ncbi:MAG: organomercurial lyase MerB [Streptosporangiales bacterium]|nr:organomercurial lyase MerB [Streptosporangiales bacterium]
MAENLDQLAEQIAVAVAQVSGARTVPGLYRPLLRLLARGAPVALDDLATAAGRPPAEVRQAVAGWPDTEYDHAGRIIGYGITLPPTPHRFTVAGHPLYTWCALDTLIFPAIIDQPADIESPCHATGAPVRLTVDPTAGITRLDPATAVVSLVVPEQRCDSVRAAFCNQVHFFATAAAAGDWVAKHPGMTVLPVADAYRLGRPLIDGLLDTAAPTPCC